MNWQKVLSLLVVAVTAALFAWSKWRARHYRWQLSSHCGCCPSQKAGQPAGSVVFRARRGERPQILFKIKP